MEVKRKPNESIGSLMRRFSRLVQQTKLVTNLKSKSTRKKKPTERVEKNRAIMRVELQGLRRHLNRLGKYDNEMFDEEKRKIKRKLDL